MAFAYEETTKVFDTNRPTFKKQQREGWEGLKIKKQW